jgi:hypothetical protein
MRAKHRELTEKYKAFRLQPDPLYLSRLIQTFFSKFTKKGKKGAGLSPPIYGACSVSLYPSAPASVLRSTVDFSPSANSVPSSLQTKGAESY